MLTRRLACIAVVVLLCASSMVWSKSRVTVDSLVTKSDALYYYPGIRGVNDLAVDLVVRHQQVDASAAAKAARVTYYYAGENLQSVSVTNLADTDTKTRGLLLSLTETLGQYIMPFPTQTTFDGMKTKLNRVVAMLQGVKGATFYEITGTPADEKSGLKELRVLLDGDGLLHQIENVLQDGSSMVAVVTNTQTEAGWHVETITTRVVANRQIRWRIERITYDVIEGYTLPVRYAVEYREEHNKSANDGKEDYLVTFENYVINKGTAAAVFPPATPVSAPAEGTAPAPASTP